MKDYSNYQLHDFLNDADFRDWVHSGLDLRHTPWEVLLEQYPGKNRELLEAKSIILNWKTHTSTISKEQSAADIKRIMEAVGQQPSSGRMMNFSFFGWKTAAAALIFLFIGWRLWPKQDLRESYTYESIVEKTAYPLKEVANTSGKTMTIYLPDSSEVTLNPGSKLSYSGQFNLDSTRNVILKGEAFFKVTRDINHPFLVLSNGITTHVLGTSFRIRSGKDKVSVEVTSGLVAVYRMDEKSTGTKEDLLLNANQQAVFTAGQNSLKKTLADNPVILAQEEDAGNFQFDETPLPKVFDQLQKSYGIEIVYDQALLKECNLTIPLAKESFFSKLDIICATIRASYSVVDNKVIVIGGGCN